MRSPHESRPFADRLRWVAVLVGLLTVQGAVHRVVLFVRFHDAGSDVATLLRCLGAGLVFDLLAYIACLLPFLALLNLLPSGWLSHSRWRAAFAWVFFSCAAFL